LGRATSSMILHMAALSICVASVGCSRIPDAPTFSPYRFVESTTSQVFDLGMISSTQVREHIRLDENLDDLGWKVTGANPQGNAGGGLSLLNAESRTLHIDLRVHMQASRSDLFELEARGLRTGKSIRLYWASKGQTLHISRSLRRDFRDGTGQSTKKFLFPVAESPLWGGNIDHLRIEFTTDPGQDIEIEAFRSLKRVVEPELLRQALAKPWYVGVGDEYRASMLAPPGLNISRSVRLPRNARFLSAYSVPNTQTTDVDFRVVVTDSPSGDLLIEKSFPWSLTSSGGWNRAEVDLAEFGGRFVTITLQTETGRALDPLEGLPSWGHPEIRWDQESTKRPNVFAISLDTLRADHVSLYGYDRMTTPNIHRWASERGTVFETTVASAPWTLPSHVSIFTGLDSLVHGVIHADPAPPSLRTLAEILREVGYTTAAVTGGSYLNPRYGVTQGFDLHRSIGGDPAEELSQETAFALDWLDSHQDDKPFFFFFHTYEIHDPYTPRDPFLNQLARRTVGADVRDFITSPVGAASTFGYRPRRNIKIRFRDGDRAPVDLPWSDVQTAIDAYDSGIAYADHYIGSILDRLESSGIADNTIIVLFSDHGESLGDHGLASHSSLYDHDLLVPLIIAPANKTERVRKVHSQVRLIDVMPTVLDLVGISPPPDIDGRTLAPLMISGDEKDLHPNRALSYAAVTNFGISVRTPDRKYIFRNSPWRATTGWEELYDLVRDPSETSALTDPDELMRFRGFAVDYIDNELEGLRIVIRNPFDDNLRGRIESSVIDRGIRTTNVSPECRLEGGRNLVFTVPPGESLELIAEKVKSGPIHLSGSAGTGETNRDLHFELQIDTACEMCSKSVVLAENRWTESLAAAHSPSITVIWRSSASDEMPAIAVEGELEEQLRALGYIQ
jgi:arylsulfatase A-like enzyme